MGGGGGKKGAGGGGGVTYRGGGGYNTEIIGNLSRFPPVDETVYDCSISVKIVHAFVCLLHHFIVR